MFFMLCLLETYRFGFLGGVPKGGQISARERNNTFSHSFRLIMSEIAKQSEMTYSRD